MGTRAFVLNRLVFLLLEVLLSFLFQHPLHQIGAVVRLVPGVVTDAGKLGVLHVCSNGLQCSYQLFGFRRRREKQVRGSWWERDSGREADFSAALLTMGL
jgi:hypothetical protein